MPVCTCCKVETEKHKLVTCFTCKQSFNHTCAGLTTTDLRNIVSKNANGVAWVCCNCRGTSGDVIAELKSMLANLTKEICNLKSQILNPTSTPPNAFDFEEIVQEVEERRARRVNIIVLGVSEPSISAKNDRNLHEKQAVGQIIKYLCPDVAIDNITLSRLGKYDPNRSKPRLIKVTLSDPALVHNILTKAKKLKDNPSYSHIRIFSDKTPKQVEYCRALQVELRRRQSEGESDIAIRYIRGTPKIVKLN